MGGVSAAAMWLLLPPATLTAPAPDFRTIWPVLRGAHHIHSELSDGTGTLDEIAAAAARVGLQFVIVTDHGNGTRVPEPAAYRSGVLCLSGVEISTDDGHYIALGLAQTPYRLGGHASDVVLDVQRFGGFGIAAHPGSLKPELRWTAWDAPFNALEWLNADSEWRDESWPSLMSALFTYTVRPAESLVRLLDRPDPLLRQWEQLLAHRRVPALAGADAHARIGWKGASEPYEDRVAAEIPRYEDSFRAFSNRVILDRQLTGDAAIDAEIVLNAIREGRLFTVVDALAELGAFEMRATNGVAVARPGDYLDALDRATIQADLAAPPGTSLSLIKDGVSIFESRDGHLEIDVAAQPGAYRIEARLPASADAPSVPWLLTNPIYVGLRDAHAHAAAGASSPDPTTARTAIGTTTWRAESSAGSESTLRQAALPDGTPALEWRFGLASGVTAGQYAAIRFPAAQEIAAHTRLQLRVQSDRPRRFWIQLYRPERQGERWGRSIYADTTLRAYDLTLAEFRAMGTVTTSLSLDRINSLMLVVDTINSRPGDKGVVWIPDIWLAR